jgi:hypothetical protein
MLSDERLREIRERAEKAGFSPWSFEPGHVGTTSECLYIGNRSYNTAMVPGYADHPGNIANASFIAHARQDIPDLLAEIDRLKAELNGAYERAAKVADDDAEDDWTDGVPRGYKIADKIRNLKEPT